MIIALDPSSVTGVAEGECGSNPLLYAVNFRDKDDDEPEETFKRAAAWLWRRVSSNPPIATLAIEMPVPPHRARGQTQWKSTLITLGLYGCFVGIAAARGIRVRPAHIASWRKYTLGHGKLKKEDAKAAMLVRCKQLGWHAPDHNAAEAGGIWLWACSKEPPR